MGCEDIGLKSYLGDARRYADLWNGGVFQGRQMVKAEELEEINPVLSKADEEITLEKTRDLVMKQSLGGQRFAVLAVENQKAIDYGMPVRIMLQEALEYHRQIKAIKRENEQAEKSIMKKTSHADGIESKEKGTSIYCDEGEFLYKVRKKDKLFPVATLVVYWGEEEWEGAKSLHEMLDFGIGTSELEGEFKKLIPEYPIHFLDLKNFEHFDYFRTELRPLLELYKRRNNKTEFLECIREYAEDDDMDDETWRMLGQLTHSKKLEKLIEERNTKKEGKQDMCKALDDLVNDAKEEGKIEGKIEGRIEYIFELLEDLGEVPEEVRKKISEQRDLEILKKWHKLAAKSTDIQEFMALSDL